MISANIDLRQLEKSIQKAGKDFGDTNEAAIARWGVATCRRLIGSTQVQGDGTEPKKIQQQTILKDANRVIFAVSKPKVVRMLETGKMRGLIIDGVLIKFQRHQLLMSPEAVYAWIEKNRDKKTGKTKRMKRQLKGVATERNIQSACRKRNKDIGKAKGGWIGAGQEIGKFQKGGSRITIGKNVSSYAHKWKTGGRARMKRSQWTPEGAIINTFSHVGFQRVLRNADIDKAIRDGGKNTITWYEKAMEAKLKKRS